MMGGPASSQAFNPCPLALGLLSIYRRYLAGPAQGLTFPNNGSHESQW
jgi:hypothetical protein